MRYVEYKLTLDLHSTSPQDVIHAVKGNTACRLNITLTEQGKPYKVEDGCTAVFKGVKPDNNKLFNPCEIIDGKVVYLFTEQTVVLPGMVNCEIRLSDAEGKLLYTPKFDIALADTAFDDDEIAVESKGESLSLGEFEELVAETNNRLEKGEFTGVGIDHVEQTTISVNDRGVNVITFYLTDGTSYDVEVRNGSSSGLTEDEKNAIAEDIKASILPVGIKDGGTGGTTAAEALKNLGAPGITFFDGTTAVNANDLIEYGVYFFQYATGVYTNLPPNNGGLNGWLVVLPDTGANAKQIWYRMGSEGNQHNTYVRTIYGYNGTISDWAKIMTSKDFTLTNGVLHINTL